MQRKICRHCGKEVDMDAYREWYHVVTNKYSCGPKDSSVAEWP